MLDKGCLHGMQRPRLAQPLDRGDLVAVVHDRQSQQLLIRRPSTRSTRPGPALAMVAALLGARQMQALAQRIQQGRTRIEPERVLSTVICRRIFQRHGRARRELAGSICGSL